MGLKDVKESLRGAVSAVAKNVKAAPEKAANAGEVVAGAATTVGGAVVDKVEEGLLLVAEAQQESQRRKFNPIAREEYLAESFDLPQLIVIEDEDLLKGNEECEGAMGWLVALKGKSEVLHMYHGFAEESGLTFVPPAQVGFAYIASPVEPKRFIADSSFFREIMKEKVAELQNIAYSLGASYCKVEVLESTTANSKTSRKGKVSGGVKKRVAASMAASNSIAQTAVSACKASSESTYEGGVAPVRPALCWFAGSKEINALIDAVCENNAGNQIKDRKFVFESSSMATLDAKAAANIDAAFKAFKGKSEGSLEEQSKEESRQVIVFTISF